MRNPVLLGAFSALTVVCFGCHTPNSATPQTSSAANRTSHQLALETYEDPDAYNVYKVLLDGKRPDGLIDELEQDTPPMSRRPIGIESQTGGDNLCFDPAAQTDSQLREAGSDYNQQNSKPRLLKPDELRFGRKVELITPSDLDSIFVVGIIPGWKRFHELHADIQGYSRLSAVGFSADKNFAIVFSGRYCGPKCGAGGIVTLTKKNGVWRRNRDQLCSWIS